MARKVLDEQSFKAREQEIIDASLALIDALGIENITMDKVVAAVPYAKGTVYKHFIGKEDLFLAMGKQAIKVFFDLFNRAVTYGGSTRERMTLVLLAYLIFSILHPVLFNALQSTKSPSVFNKASEARQTEIRALEEKLITLIHMLVEQAISEGSLQLPKNFTVHQVCFYMWSAAFGTINLLVEPSEEIDKRAGRDGLVVEQELVNQSNLLLDGMQWQPLSSEKDHQQSLATALQKIFANELATMAANGRELNI